MQSMYGRLLTPSPPSSPPLLTPLATHGTAGSHRPAGLVLPAGGATPPAGSGCGGAVPHRRRRGQGSLPRGPQRRRRLVVPALIVVGSLAAGFGGGLLAGGQGDTSSGRVSASPVSTSDRSSSTLDGETLDVAAIIDRLSASVVSIETTVQARQGPFLREGEAAGTGIVIDDEGTILTNAHVVEGATDISVAVGSEASRARRHSSQATPAPTSRCCRSTMPAAWKRRPSLTAEHPGGRRGRRHRQRPRSRRRA